MWDIAESSVVHVTIAVFSDDSVALEKDLQPGYDVPGPAESYTAVTDLETLQESLAAFAEREIEPDIVQIAFTRSEKVGGRHMMRAGNPIYVITGSYKQ